MGCDIHIVVEEKCDDTWVGLHACPYGQILVYATIDGKYQSVEGSASWGVRSRNYDLFAALAGVRGNHPAYPAASPRGMPDDASQLASMLSDQYGTDGHSHSWMLMSEALPIYRHVCFDHIPKLLTADKPPEDWEDLEKFGIDGYDRSLDDFRIVFWFDN